MTLGFQVGYGNQKIPYRYMLSQSRFGELDFNSHWEGYE